MLGLSLIQLLTKRDGGGLSTKLVLKCPYALKFESQNCGAIWQTDLNHCCLVDAEVCMTTLYWQRVQYADPD